MPRYLTGKFPWWQFPGTPRGIAIAENYLVPCRCSCMGSVPATHPTLCHLLMSGLSQPAGQACLCIWGEERLKLTRTGKRCQWDAIWCIRGMEVVLGILEGSTQEGQGDGCSVLTHWKAFFPILTPLFNSLIVTWMLFSWEPCCACVMLAWECIAYIHQRAPGEDDTLLCPCTQGRWHRRAPTDAGASARPCLMCNSACSTAFPQGLFSEELIAFS